MSGVWVGPPDDDCPDCGGLGYVGERSEYGRLDADECPCTWRTADGRPWPSSTNPQAARPQAEPPTESRPNR